MTDNIKVLNEFLPKAQAERLGAIKIGDTLNLDVNEVLNVDSASMTSAYMTNCLTEIPQDIKLELNNGTLTLKAGSKVYIPNGFEQDGTTKKFNTYIFASDTVFASYVNSRRALFLTSTQELAGQSVDLEFFSGTTAPTGYTYMVWYDTTNNLVKYTTDSGSTWVSGNSFPFAIVSGDNSTSTWTSIDQVFNGFGYIGSVGFVLPGVQGLIPNGRKENGALNNITFSVNNVILRIFSSDYTGQMVWGIDGNTTTADVVYFMEQDTSPTDYTTTWAWLNPETNIMSMNYWNGSTNIYTPAIQSCIIAKMHRTLGHIDWAEFQKPLRIGNVYNINKELAALQDTKLDVSRIQYVSAVPGNPQDGVIYLIAQ